MRTFIEGLDRGVGGTSKTIERMHKLTALGKLDPTIQKLATWIRLQVPSDRRGNTRETLDALFWWVKKHKVFQRDPFQIEKIEHPIEAMRPVIEARRAGIYKGPGLFVGDCDTIAGVFLASLGGVLGFNYSFETAKVDASRPDEFSHVWVSFRVGNEWYPLDPSTEGATPGWRPPVSGPLFRRWPEKAIEDTLGMSGMNNAHRGNGLGYDPASPMVPEPYFGNGIPDFYGDGGPIPDLPRVDPGDLDVHIPHEPRGSTPVRPQERPMQLQPGDDYYAPMPALTPRRGYVATLPYGGANPAYPFARQVEVVMENPIAVRRRVSREIVMRPQEVSGMGMGEDVSPSSFILDTSTKATDDAAKEASGSVWDSIVSGISAVAKQIPGITQALITRTQASAATKLANATARVTGSAVSPMQFTSRSWYANPLVWLGGALALGTGAYFMTRSGGKRRRA